ncbi:MAG: transporter substrate-binding domain-containing protein [Candidatus Paceibacterota bacterium]
MKASIGTAIMFIIVIILACLISAFIFTTSSNSNQSSFGEQKDMVIASGHPDWKPIMWRSGLEITGAGPEITGMVFKDMGMGVRTIYIGPWDIVQEKTKTGENDVIVALYYTPERAEYLVYSISYTTDPVAVFVKQGSGFTYTNKRDLIGLKGAATIGDSYGTEMDAFILDAKLDLKRVATPEEAFALVRSGQADYFLYSGYAGKKMLGKATDIVEAGIVSQQNFYIGVSKKSEYAKYMDQINASLQRHINNGDVARAIEKYNR